MWWSRKRVDQPTALSRSIADPALAVLFGGSPINGVSVSEYTVLGNSAFYRAIMLISGTLASLPFRSLRKKEDGETERVSSIFDDPDGEDGQTDFEWRQTAFIHLLLHGDAFAFKVKTQAGGLARLPLIHPLSVRIEDPTPEEYRTGNLPPGEKWFVVTLNDNSQQKLTSKDIWHVPGPSLDGKRGISLISVARQSIATTLSGDKAASKLFENGFMVAALATPDDDANPDITDELPEIRRQLNRELTGVDRAGAVAIINRRIKISPLAMTSQDAQFLQSRQFQIEEVSRLTGVPPHLLMQTEKQTSWGTGVEEQNRALGRTVLLPWSIGFEKRASRLLAKPRWVEFDFSGLERPSPEKEIELLLKQTGGKPILTVNEARAIRNLPPVPGGDVLIPDSTSSVDSEENEEGVDSNADPAE